MTAVTCALERPDQPEVARLIDELDAYQKPLYPPESHHGIDMDALLEPRVLFAVARDALGEAVGCAAIVMHEEWGELKRMYVMPAQRGHGAARALLAFIEAKACARGLGLVRLETGTLQHPAIRFYERAGYTRRGPFAGYGPDPLSVFMEKRLAPAKPAPAAA